MENIFGSVHYNSIAVWMKTYFGKRMVKLAIDGGFTCPNRDGTCGTGGCIYCSESGSGDFASDIESQIRLTSRKWPDAGYLAYFQNHTNTYAPVEVLRKVWDNALSHPQIEGLVIATRPDCLQADVISLLREYDQKTFLWVELGLQTASDTTARLINRCYETAVFEDAMKKLKAAGIRVVVHEILGLPGEDRQQMLQTADYVNAFEPFGIKLHMLHIMSGTAIGKIYQIQNAARNKTACNIRSDETNEMECCMQNDRKRKYVRKRELSEDEIKKNQHPDFRDLKQVTGFPDLEQVTGFPDLKQVTGFPDLEQVTGFPELKLLTLDEYVNTVVDILEKTPQSITIHRLTGDAPQKMLLAPDWTSNKHVVLGAIQHQFSVRESFQGKHCKK